MVFDYLWYNKIHFEYFKRRMGINRNVYAIRKHLVNCINYYRHSFTISYYKIEEKS